MKSEIRERTRFDQIRYSQCWEDPRLLIEALEIRPVDDVLSVTSAGCNTLALLLEGPRSIVAIDFNPVQNHVLQLKVAAVKALEYPEFLRFLGVRESTGRLDYYQRVRRHLPAEAQA